MTGSSPDGLRALVAGETVTGLALAALLERRGVEVTRTGDRTPVDGAPAPLALDALPVLRDLGVAVPTTGFDHVAVERGDCAALCFREGIVPYAERTALRDRLREVLDTTPRRAGVDRVEGRGDGATVRFEDGERARFDLVVGADGANSFLRTAAGLPLDARGGVHEWSFRAGRALSLPTPREAWAPGVLAAATPLDGTVRVRLAVADSGEGRPQELASAGLSRLGSALLGGEPPDRARYQRLPDPAAAATWRADRVAFCGGAAAPLAGLSGLSPALGVGDAAVLAAAVGDTDCVPAALDRYEARRRRRLAAVREAAGETRYPPTGLEGPLGRVAALRSVALGGPTLPARPPPADGRRV